LRDLKVQALAGSVVIFSKAALKRKIGKPTEGKRGGRRSGHWEKKKGAHLKLPLGETAGLAASFRSSGKTAMPKLGGGREGRCKNHDRPQGH